MISGSGPYYAPLNEIDLELARREKFARGYTTRTAGG